MAAVPRVVPVSEFFQYLGRPGGTPTPEVEAIAAGQIIGAEEYVEGKIPYELAPVTGQRKIPTFGETIVRLPGGLRAATLIELDGREITEDAYQLVGLRGRPFHTIWIPWGSRQLTIDGDWGFEECPEMLRNAVKAYAARDHFSKLNKQADITQGADGTGSSYFDRAPSVTRAAIDAYSVVSV